MAKVSQKRSSIKSDSLPASTKIQQRINQLGETRERLARLLSFVQVVEAGSPIQIADDDVAFLREAV